MNSIQTLPATYCEIRTLDARTSKRLRIVLALVGLPVLRPDDAQRIFHGPPVFTVPVGMTLFSQIGNPCDHWGAHYYIEDPYGDQTGGLICFSTQIDIMRIG